LVFKAWRNICKNPNKVYVQSFIAGLVDGRGILKASGSQEEETLDAVSCKG
jgi:hypothetical protein